MVGYASVQANPLGQLGAVFINPNEPESFEFGTADRQVFGQKGVRRRKPLADVEVFVGTEGAPGWDTDRAWLTVAVLTHVRGKVRRRAHDPAEAPFPVRPTGLETQSD